MKFIVELTAEQYRNIVERADNSVGYESDEEFNPMDYSGGNYDDCYQMGYDHADVEAAREILAMLGNAVEQ